MSTDADADIDRLPFLEYARRMLAETDTATRSTNSCSVR